MSKAESNFGFSGEARFIIAGTGATAKGHPTRVMSPTSSLRQARVLGWFDYTPPELSSFMTHRRSKHEIPPTEQWSTSRTLTSKLKLETQRGQHQLQSTETDEAGEEPYSFQSPVPSSRSSLLQSTETDEAGEEPYYFQSPVPSSRSSFNLSPLLSCEDNSPGPRPWCAKVLAMEEPCSAAVAAADEESWAAYEPEEYSWSHLSMPGLPDKANPAEERAKSSPSHLDELLEEIDAFRKLGFHDEAQEYNS